MSNSPKQRFSAMQNFESKLFPAYISLCVSATCIASKCHESLERNTSTPVQRAVCGII